jgi:hypothetical protein
LRPVEPERDLREQLKPLASQRGFVEGEAGDVPTRAVEPRDDAAGDGVARARKDDRDRPRLPLEGNGRRGRACQDDVGLQADQLLCERSYPIDAIAVPPKVGLLADLSDCSKSYWPDLPFVEYCLRIGRGG